MKPPHSIVFLFVTLSIDLIKLIMLRLIKLIFCFVLFFYKFNGKIMTTCLLIGGTEKSDFPSFSLRQACFESLNHGCFFFLIITSVS